METQQPLQRTAHHTPYRHAFCLSRLDKLFLINIANASHNAQWNVGPVIACYIVAQETAKIVNYNATHTCISNVGPGFGEVGPAVTYGWMSAPAKLLLSFAMVLGRLEIYTLLVIFLPSFWKH